MSWTANREKAVNSAGGGYRVYYSTQSIIAIPGASYVNVPNVPGANTPTSALITQLATGIYYIQVLAYSTLNPTGAVSQQISITVP